MAHVENIILVIHEVTQSWSGENGVYGVSSSLKVDGVRVGKQQGTRGQTNFAETDGGGLFTETLAAEVKTVFADETSLVGAQTAEGARVSAPPEFQYRRINYRTIGESPFRIFWDERTKRRRVSW